MRSRPLMILRLSTAPVQNIGDGPHGLRLTFPINGGSFDGDRLRGKVLPGGDDWVVQRADGVLELDLRITLETDDGALIATVDTGNLTRAAARLRRSLQSVSRSLSALEAQLGVVLIRRTTRAARPTEAGLAFHRRVSAALREIALAEAELCDTSDI